MQNTRPHRKGPKIECKSQTNILILDYAQTYCKPASEQVKKFSMTKTSWKFSKILGKLVTKKLLTMATNIMAIWSSAFRRFCEAFCPFLKQTKKSALKMLGNTRSLCLLKNVCLVCISYL